MRCCRWPIKHNVGIMIRTPLARGLLSGKFASGQAIPAEQQWRRPTGDRLQLRLARVEQLRFLVRDGQTLAQAALRWLLAQPGVHCVIPGARTVEQLEDNIKAVDGDLTAEEVAQVKALQTRVAGRRSLVAETPTGGRPALLTRKLAAQSEAHRGRRECHIRIA